MLKNSKTQRASLSVEALEERSVLSATSAVLYGAGWGLLSVQGNDNPSNVVVYPSGSQIVVHDYTNGFHASYAAADVQRVRFFGGSGADRFVNNVYSLGVNAYGEGGSDYLEGYNGGDYLDGGTGADTLVGYGGNDILVGGSNNDILKGMDGNDVMYGDQGNDILDGGAGDDWMRGGGDQDYLVGGADNDKLYGDAGNDFLWGESGNDWLYGGTGADYLYGGADSDTLDGGADGFNDQLWGGTGADTFYQYWASEAAFDNVHDWVSGETIITDIFG